MDTFKPDVISETILRRLLKQDIIYHIKVKSREKAKTDPAAIIYQQGKAVDYFVLILEGRVEVTVGKENMMFESGPFTYFGSQALTANIGIGEILMPRQVTFMYSLACIYFSTRSSFNTFVTTVYSDDSPHRPHYICFHVII